MKQWNVQDVMTRRVVAVRLAASYQEIVTTLATNQVSAVPVLDSVDTVLGVVSEADLLHKVEFSGENTDPKVFEWGTRRVSRAKAQAATARDLMTTPAVTILADAPLVKAAQEMAKHNVKRLPVVDELGRLEGIVSRSDLLGVFVRPDTDLRDDIVEGVLRRILQVDPIAVEVDVTNGIVTLAGQVDRRSTAEILAHITKTVPGVVTVVEKVSWIYDDTVVPSAAGL